MLYEIILWCISWVAKAQDTVFLSLSGLYQSCVEPMSGEKMGFSSKLCVDHGEINNNCMIAHKEVTD